MSKLSLLLICLVCLLLPCKAYLSNVAQPAITIGPMLVAKIQAETSIASSILQSLSFTISPYFIGAFASPSATASVYGAYSRGGQYKYNEMKINFRETLRKGQRITQVARYSSPVQSNTWTQKLGQFARAFTDVSHHQVIFQVDNLVWMLLSFGSGGLEVDASMSKKYLVKRRKNNRLIDHKNVNFPIEKLRRLLQIYEGQTYDMLLWNCQHFAEDLWSLIDSDCCDSHSIIYHYYQECCYCNRLKLAITQDFIYNKTFAKSPVRRNMEISCSDFFTLCILFPCSASHTNPAFSSGSVGLAYMYGAIDTFFQQKLNAANKITAIELYESLVKDFQWLSHHQIIFQVDHEYWLLASLGYNGLEVGASKSKETLVIRRRRNRLIDSKYVNVNAEMMIIFLRNYESKSFDLLKWNCQDFARSIWILTMAFDNYQ